MAASTHDNSDFDGVSPAVYMQEITSALTPERLDGTNYDEWSLNA
jgi:hypothetical protein